MRKNQNKNDEIEEQVNVKEVLAKYLKYWYLFAISVVFFVLAAKLYLFYTPISFLTQGKIKILEESKKVDFKLDNSFVFGGNIYLNNDIEILKSYRLLERVTTNLHLNVECYSQGMVRISETWLAPFSIIPLDQQKETSTISKFTIEITRSGYLITDEVNSKNYTIAGYSPMTKTPALPFIINLSNKSDIKDCLGKKYSIVINPKKNTIINLSKQLKVEGNIKDCHVLYLSLDSPCKERSEAIINEIITQYNNDGIVDRQQISIRTIDFVNDRFNNLTGELDSIESKRGSYKKTNQISNIINDEFNTMHNKSESENDVVKAQTQVLLSNILEKNLTTESNFGLLPENIGLDNRSLNSFVSEYNHLIMDRDKLILSAGKNHPNVILFNNSITSAKENILNSIRTFKSQLKATLSQVESFNERNIAKFKQLPDVEKGLRKIERQQSVKENLYMLLLQKREEASINLAITTPSIKIVDYAVTQIDPISPKKTIIYLGAVIVGLLLPFLVLLLLFTLDTKVYTKQDLQKNNLFIPILAELPNIETNDKEDSTAQNSYLNEILRMLATNLNFILPSSETKKGSVIMVTSSIKGEGKSFISSKLAKTYSELNKKVLLIGADLRNPKLHMHLGQDKAIKGLSIYLHSNEVNWREDIMFTSAENANLSYILAGQIPPNPSLLLSSDRFQKLLDEAKTEFDYIIIDTAPTMLFSDTLIMSKLADATLYITKYGYTDKNLLEFSNSLHHDHKLNNMAYVLNGVDFKKSYGKDYVYGYEYGNEEVEIKKSILRRMFRQKTKRK